MNNTKCNAIAEYSNQCRRCCAFCDKADCEKRCKNKPDVCGCLDIKCKARLSPEEQKAKMREYQREYARRKAAANPDAVKARRHLYYENRKAKKGETDGK